MAPGWLSFWFVFCCSFLVFIFCSIHFYGSSFLNLFTPFWTVKCHQMGKMTKPFDRLEHQWSRLFSVTSSAKNPWEESVPSMSGQGKTASCNDGPVKGEGLLRMMQSRISSESGNMNSILICSCLDATHRISILADFHSTCYTFRTSFLTLGGGLASFWYHH